METKELSITLREMARSQRVPLCDKFYNEWSEDDSIDVLLDRYKKGFDFAVENDYPTLAFIRANFSKADLHRHLIYIDEEVNEICSNSHTIVCLGKCTGSIEFNSWSVGNVYLRHESAVKVISDDMARVMVTEYENSECIKRQYGDSHLTIYDKREKKD